MKEKDFTMTLFGDRSPQEVFDAVLNVRGWWQGFYSEQITGDTMNLNDQFRFQAGDGAHDTTQRLIELVPNKKVAWLVTSSKLTFIEKHDEWKGSKIIFEISRKDDKTVLRFTHEGLTPEVECYEACSTAWSQYLKEKLQVLISSKKKAHIAR